VCECARVAFVTKSVCRASERVNMRVRVCARGARVSLNVFASVWDAAATPVKSGPQLYTLPTATQTRRKRQTQRTRYQSKRVEPLEIYVVPKGQRIFHVAFCCKIRPALCV
jgi:hypothetical protein